MRPFQIPVNGLGWDKDMSLASNGYFHGIYYSPFIDELDDGPRPRGPGVDGPRARPRASSRTSSASRSPAQDTVSHAYGPESEENLDALRRLDVQLGRLFEALDRGFPEGKVVLALSADHGFQPVPELAGAARQDLHGRPGPLRGTAR